MHHTYKTLLKVFGRIPQHSYGKTIGEYLGDCRSGRTTIVQICSAKQVLGKCWEYNIDVHHSPWLSSKYLIVAGSKMLYNIIFALEILEKLVQITQVTITNVRILCDVTESFPIVSDLRGETCSHSPQCSAGTRFVICVSMICDINDFLLFKSTQIEELTCSIIITASSIPDDREDQKPSTSY